MNYYDIQNVVAETVYSLEGIGEENAILFKFELHANCFAAGTYDERSYFEVVIVRDSNYKMVFHRYGDHPLQLEEWVFKAYHYSCWRDSGLDFFNEYMNMRDNLVEYQKKYKVFENIQEANSNVNFKFGIGKFFKLVNGQTEKIGDHNYKLKI